MTDTADPVHGHGWNSADRGGGWSWGEPTRGEHFRRCSFCGSIHPDDLAAEPAWRAEWADQKYGWPHKFYVDIPNRNPDALFVISSQSGGSRGAPEPGYMGMKWVAWDDLTPEQMAIVERDGWGPRPGAPEYKSDFIGFGTRASHSGKFYTAHLADPQLSSETKEVIAKRSGVWFTFEEGRVRWERYHG